MSLPAITVPNAPANLAIGRGVVSWSAGLGTPTWVDLGNCSSFMLTPASKQLEHFSSRAGIKIRDMLIPYEFTAQLKFKLEEIIPLNLALAFMGTVSGEVITGMSLATLLGQFKFAGANAVGWQYDWIFPSASLVPSAQLELIGDNWQELEVTANLLAVSGSFFTATRTG